MATSPGGNAFRLGLFDKVMLGHKSPGLPINVGLARAIINRTLRYDFGPGSARIKAPRFIGLRPPEGPRESRLYLPSADAFPLPSFAFSLCTSGHHRPEVANH
ncbi:methyl-accepting chemotaxis sensory transducer [Anopheles sinensis]|uniref:Methyl-accepting chemotaxis sensory transducer n=1 Tax=Anopheles sinensis TaxID=74873 RepID=A0A084VEM6_ANOSI|nr:methyl-accepting chemotaxis sensory transducer [Anopheles sinensis]